MVSKNKKIRAREKESEEAFKMTKKTPAQAVF
jgi:hypothetical protein